MSPSRGEPVIDEGDFGFGGRAGDFDRPEFVGTLGVGALAELREARCVFVNLTVGDDEHSQLAPEKVVNRPS